MPKILINEKDRTSPGTPDSYANYTVLITGFAANKTPTGADSNDVFEFSTADAFKDTIGLVPPKRTKQVSVGSGSVDIYHYGNQMAYELLNMGYSVIYKVIDDVKVLTDSKFWEGFKDKASYDFRFVTHGLLESTDITDEAGYSMLIAKLDTVEAAKAELEKIYNAVTEELGEKPDLNILEDYEKLNTKYQELLDKENDISALFKKLTGENAGTEYAEYRTAAEGTEEDYTILTNELNSLVGDGVTTSVINGANTCIANLAKYVAENDAKELPGRGDCIALIEIDEKKYTKTASPIEQIISAINTMSGIDSANGKYCALTVPSVHYKMTAHKDFDNNVKFPAAFHYLACFMNSLKLGFAEWYAAAGYTRGVASYMIDHTTVKLGEIAINALEPRYYVNQQQEPKFACNVIANFRGSYYLWGNRTAHPLGKKGSLDTGDLVASSFLNIRQLCCTIKKQLYVACRTFTFDPNSDTLWVNFCNAIRPTLEVMKADQGIRDYKILKVYTDKKATLKAKIRIIPIEAVEDFDLEVSLEDSFGETTAVVTE